MSILYGHKSPAIGLGILLLTSCGSCSVTLSHVGRLSQHVVMCDGGQGVTSRNTHITNADTLRPVTHPTAISLRGEQLPTSVIHGSWIYPDLTLFPRIVKSPTSCYFPTLHFPLIVILLTNTPPPPHYPRHSFRIPISPT